MTFTGVTFINMPLMVKNSLLAFGFVFQLIHVPKSRGLDMKQPTGNINMVMKFQWTCSVKELLTFHKSTLKMQRCDL